MAGIEHTGMVMGTVQPKPELKAILDTLTENNRIYRIRTANLNSLYTGLKGRLPVRSESLSEPPSESAPLIEQLNYQLEINTTILAELEELTLALSRVIGYEQN